MKGTVGTLSRALDCTGSDRESFTMPAGCSATVYPSSGPRCVVVVDGRVYRAVAADVRVSR